MKESSESNEKILFDEDAKQVLRLRRYYKRNFVNGDSDESFLNWIETTLQTIDQINANPRL